MRKKQIDLFFKHLNQALDQPGTVILTGAGAGSLMGHIRPSLDLDFEIRLKPSQMKNKTFIAQRIRQVARETGIAVNFSEDIGHWSMVSYLDYRKTAFFYKQFGKLEVKLISPEYWTIGKMARFYQLDIQDMTRIIKKKKLKPEILVKLWRRASDASPVSLELGQFKDHVQYFLHAYAHRLWGKKTNLAKLLNQFE